MTVHCEGDYRAIEQLDSRNFESELNRLRLGHDHFIIYVGFVASARSPATLLSITVANVVTGQQRVYVDGQAQGWMVQCAQDLAAGVFD
jgi:hypothetical protein